MNIRHKIPPISWKHSQSDTPFPLAAMWRTQLGFQNGDCVLKDVELENQGNETQIFAFKETIDV